LLALRLGESLSLPVAAGVPVLAPIFFEGTEVGEDLYWGSLAVRESPPPADCGLLVAKNIDVATGIVVFDAWICNIDRHELNLIFDVVNGEIVLFDHGEAICNSVGPEFLLNHRDNLGLGDSHAVAYELPHLNQLDKWLNRVAQIDTGEIVSVVRSTTEKFLTVEEQLQLAHELDRRRRTLPQLFQKHATNREIFPCLEHDLLPIADTRNVTDNYQI